MKDGHTPGPWYVDEGANGDVLVVGEHPELGEDVCHVYGGNDGDKARALADARAIAATPGLLPLLNEALAELREWATCSCHPPGTVLDDCLGTCVQAKLAKTIETIQPNSEGESQ